MVDDSGIPIVPTNSTGLVLDIGAELVSSIRNILEESIVSYSNALELDLSSVLILSEYSVMETNITSYSSGLLLDLSTTLVESEFTIMSLPESSYSTGLLIDLGLSLLDEGDTALVITYNEEDLDFTEVPDRFAIAGSPRYGTDILSTTFSVYVDYGNSLY